MNLLIASDSKGIHPWKSRLLLAAAAGFVIGLVFLSINFSGLRKEYHWTRQIATPLQSTTQISRDSVMVLLSRVEDPELGLNIVELGLIYDVQVAGTAADIRMGLTTPECPYVSTIIDNVRDALFSSPGLQSIDLRISLDPPWTVERISPEGMQKLHSWITQRDRK